TPTPTTPSPTAPRRSTSPASSGSSTSSRRSPSPWAGSSEWGVLPAPARSPDSAGRAVPGRSDADDDGRALGRGLGPVELDGRLGLVDREAVTRDEAAGAVTRAGDAAGALLMDCAAAVEDEVGSPGADHLLAVLDELLLDQILIPPLDPAALLLPG